ncbi:MAG: helix-turn-helix transcriptional regulator [Taibaiella sp.]|jgi:AraC-like DNA-binding protein
MEYIIAIGIFQALVAAGLLWKSKLRNSADGILILMVACIATHLSIKFIIFTFVQDKAVRVMMNTFINFCYGPLLYLYTQKVLKPQFNIASRWYVFIPLMAGIIGYFSVASVLATAPEAGHEMLYWYNTISFWIFIPGDLFYAVVAILMARKFAPSFARERNMITQIASCFAILSLMAIVFSTLMRNGHDVNLLSRCIAYSLLIMVSLWIVRYRYVAFNSIAAEEKPVKIPHVKTDPVETVKPAEAYYAEEPKKAQMDKTEMETVWQVLEDSMQNKAVYTDSELNLDKLALLTAQNKYHISETLNRHGGKSFYQYINKYRIQHILNQMQMLQERDISINMLTLAFDAGFNSKSSFNRYFKEITGYTPTDYSKVARVKGAPLT